MIIRRIVLCVVTAALVGGGWTPASAQADRAKAAAFADVDRLCTDFATQQHVLGAAWTMNCERGKLEVAMTLAPTMPPKVQLLGVRVAPPAPPHVPEWGLGD